MILRMRLSIIACLAAAVGAGAGAAESPDDSPRARAAKYYAVGLEPPLLELRKGALLFRTCTTRLRRACSKEQRRLAAGNRTLLLLDELTLFPQRPAADPAAAVTKADALRERISAAGTALMGAAGDYDRRLIARYGAVLRTCPGDTSDSAHRDSLDALTVVDLRDFLGLAGADYDQARQALTAEESQTTTTLRGLSPEDCDAALTVGQLLMEMLNGKLEPWTREDRRVGNVDREFDFNGAIQPKKEEAPTREVAVSVAGNFVTLVATELQLTVFPDTAPRIKAIAEAEEAGKAE